MLSLVGPNSFGRSGRRTNFGRNKETARTKHQAGAKPDNPILLLLAAVKA